MISDYMKLFEAELGDKAKDMYQGKFLQSIRHTKQDENTYITGRISAEMLKKRIYQVDVKLDDHGIVQESQCECGAGMGPEAHCKHVQLIF